MDTEQIRQLVFEFLAANIGNGLQIGEVTEGVRRLANDRGWLQNPYQGAQPVRGNPLHRGDSRKINDVLWTLITQGIILPGIDDHNANLPFFHITDYGEQCLREQQVLPHDPDGYLNDIRTRVPQIDPLIAQYLTESLQTFLTGNYLASTVMLGVASEQAFLLLFSAFKTALQSPTEQARLEAVENKQIRTKYEEFRKRLMPKRGQLPQEISDVLEISIDGIFSWIRTCRNDAGHPTGRTIQRQEAFANLQLFSTYVERVYSLIDHLNANPME